MADELTEEQRDITRINLRLNNSREESIDAKYYYNILKITDKSFKEPLFELESLKINEDVIYNADSDVVSKAVFCSFIDDMTVYINNNTVNNVINSDMIKIKANSIKISTINKYNSDLITKTCENLQDELKLQHNLSAEETYSKDCHDAVKVALHKTCK